MKEAALKEIRMKVWNSKREFAYQYLKSHPCKDCGESDPIILDFDHVGEKRRNVSSIFGGNFSLQYLKDEISKCEVRCVNCHRKKTAKQLNYYQYM